MVQDLPRVVEQRTLRCLFHDFPQRHALVFRVGNALVKIIDVSLEMPAIMDFHCLLADYRCKGTRRVKKNRQLETGFRSPHVCTHKYNFVGFVLLTRFLPLKFVKMPNLCYLRRILHTACKGMKQR